MATAPAMNRATRQLFSLATAGGLRPHTDPATRHGLYLILLNSPGPDGLFGALHVSARTGRTVRANLTHGNWGQEKTYIRYADIRTVLASWAALQRGTART